MSNPAQRDKLIEHIIQEELIEIHFQPIVSISTKKIYAYEALTRCNYNGQNITPQVLFNLAIEKDCVLELDLLTRKKAIEKFYDYYLLDNDLMLFLNFESTSINTFDPVENTYCFSKIISKLGIPSKNFMLEIKEDEINNLDALRAFCFFYKELGFSIALDDFGTGNSAFDRIDLIKPNLIKIDKSLFVDIKNNKVNREIVHAISNMCKNIGTQVLAEGVEEKDAIFTSLELGINLFQGYYFSRPLVQITDTQKREMVLNILDIGNSFRDIIIEGIKEKRELISKFNTIAKKIINKIDSIVTCHPSIQKKFHKYDDIEAIYLIDEKSSKQIHNTVMLENPNSRFKPTNCGSEHFLKEYYYVTKESKKGIYLSQRYISFASGNICQTFAKIFEINHKKYILCMDIVI